MSSLKKNNNRGFRRVWAPDPQPDEDKAVVEDDWMNECIRSLVELLEYKSPPSFLLKFSQVIWESLAKQYNSTRKILARQSALTSLD